MPSYDYRAARDRIMGLIRDSEGKVVSYLPGTATTLERMLLVALVEFAPNIEPSTAALAIMLGTSERQIRRLIQRCEAKGLLRVEHRVGQRSRYHLLWPSNPGLMVPPDAQSPLTNGPHTPDQQSSPPRTNSPPKQTIEADKKADNGCASQSDTPPLALEPSPSRPKRKAPGKKKREANAPSEPPDPRVVALRDHYVAEYERTKQSKPVLTGKQWPRAMRSFKELLEATRALDSATSIVTRAFADEWHRQNQCQPWEIVKNANKFTGHSVARSKPNGARAPQNHNVDVTDGCKSY